MNSSEDPANQGALPRPWTEAEWERFIREHEGRPAEPPAADWDDEALLVQLGLSEPDLPGPDRSEGLREDFGDEEGAQIRHIPAFRLAHEFAAAVRAQHEAELGTAGSAAWRDACWADLVGEALLVAQQIASGHGLGYEDDHICGNIVKCRDGLAHVERGISLLQRLRNGDRDRQALDHLMGTAVFMRMVLQQRITALRQRVWWDDLRPTG